ncbi:hypothetical protein [Roseimaritima sediminicola]|uniref:hypothetical protein n=1 Tax=Roseimaritima sediminicola TaxID=2662066 RepID=UPI00129846C9|nr:hypothetical protein [Roseimaritima sediminicola]
MHDLPTATSPLADPHEEPSAFSRRKRIKLGLLALTILSIVGSWRGAEQTLVRPAEEAPVAVAPQPLSAAQSHELALRFVHHADQLDDQQYQAAALARDAQIRAARQRRYTPPPASAPDAPRDRWQRQVDQMREYLKDVQEFPEGSVQWHMRNQLDQYLQEEPGR